MQFFVCFVCVLLFLLCLFVFSLLLRVGLRFSLIPSFQKNAKAMLAMAEIALPLYIFSCSFFYKGDVVV